MAWVRMSAARRRGHLGRHGERVERVHHPERGAQQAVRDARLHVLIHDVRHRHRGGLAAGAGGGGHRDQRAHRSGHRHALADRLVDVVEQRRRVAGEEIGGLARVDACCRRPPRSARPSPCCARTRPPPPWSDRWAPPPRRPRRRPSSPAPRGARARARGGPSSEMWRSVKISALRMPRRLASKPISSMAPSPNLIGEFSITNTVSVGRVTPFMKASSGWRCVACPARPRL